MTIVSTQILLHSNGGPFHNKITEPYRPCSIVAGFANPIFSCNRFVLKPTRIDF